MACNRQKCRERDAAAQLRICFVPRSLCPSFQWKKLISLQFVHKMWIRKPWIINHQAAPSARNWFIHLSFTFLCHRGRSRYLVRLRFWLHRRPSSLVELHFPTWCGQVIGRAIRPHDVSSVNERSEYCFRHFFSQQQDKLCYILDSQLCRSSTFQRIIEINCTIMLYVRAKPGTRCLYENAYEPHEMQR